ncbi:Dolichyl-diphosphooligosaccharide-protein glycosyltransferase subunit dad1 [Scheffersomyces spartinae]|uniref:Dolichyl-diphosphooligosaccharide-protein glycosyltransferase subunit dad1 n=1 Tax=Scheffersomyces spartinae TaxID=45513 RepID=A0A9P7V7D2_9ASCO|nr:Dolichyl-diphosphooligosaccharide-protein glycosyltransferase subunit dad1 [Scheffersomyces spartinae]KAG7192571.1 Dolichyl-diphosphooligosaccharide-protein glycosyltransferase subunit dad1 [Scheffersomyces spartinae]
MSSTYFEQQRDLLFKQITKSLDESLYHLECVNRVLSACTVIGKGSLVPPGDLWRLFYDGLAQMEKRKQQAELKAAEDGIIGDNDENQVDDEELS